MTSTIMDTMNLQTQNRVDAGLLIKTVNINIAPVRSVC